MNLVESILDFAISPAPAMVQIFQPASTEGTPVSQPDVKKFIITDKNAGSEVLYGMEVKSPSPRDGSSGPDLRGFYITSNTGTPLIKLGYLYQRQLTFIEFSTPTDDHICKAYLTLNPSFICGILCCPCFPCVLCCLCTTVPTGYIKFRDGDQKDLMLLKAYLSKKYVAKSPSGKGPEIARLKMPMTSEETSSIISFNPETSADDKLLLLAFAIGQMDYDRIYESRKITVRRGRVHNSNGVL